MNDTTITAPPAPPPAPPAPTPQLPAVRAQREIRVVEHRIDVLDTAKFEHMQRVATAMASMSLIPEALTHEKDSSGNLEPLPFETVVANCFLVVNQAVRWNMDPFAVAQCVSVVHGKLCHEGKLIAAALDSNLGVKLEYEITGQGENMRVVVSATDRDGNVVRDSKGNPKTVEGSVAEWKTTGKGSPWSAPGGYPRMLRYRGAREWGRVHESAVMLGVYAPDEFDDDARSAAARDVTPPVPPSPPPAPPPAQRAEPPSPPAAPSPAQPWQTDPNREFVAQWLRDLDGAFGGAEDHDTLDATREKHMLVLRDQVPEDDYKRAQALYLSHHARIEAAPLVEELEKLPAKAIEITVWSGRRENAERTKALSPAARETLNRAITRKMDAIKQAERK